MAVTLLAFHACCRSRCRSIIVAHSQGVACHQRACPLANKGRQCIQGRTLVTVGKRHVNSGTGRYRLSLTKDKVQRSGTKETLHTTQTPDCSFGFALQHVLSLRLSALRDFQYLSQCVQPLITSKSLELATKDCHKVQINPLNVSWLLLRPEAPVVMPKSVDLFLFHPQRKRRAFARI